MDLAEKILEIFFEKRSNGRFSEGLIHEITLLGVVMVVRIIV